VSGAAPLGWALESVGGRRALASAAMEGFEWFGKEINFLFPASASLIFFLPDLLSWMTRFTLKKLLNSF
jgi:hypothetical protein